jgi:hypothetical protein
MDINKCSDRSIGRVWDAYGLAHLGRDGIEATEVRVDDLRLAAVCLRPDQQVRNVRHVVMYLREPLSGVIRQQTMRMKTKKEKKRVPSL